MNMTDNPIVAIRCIAYNQEKFIDKTLEGFVIQKTTFPFIAIVHDDVSTDGTADVIRKYASLYPNIIKPIYEVENQYSKRDGSLNRIMDEAIPSSVKYVAYCEGDDVWIDPLKLQKQVDFLEANPDYGLCHTNYNVINENGQPIKKDKVFIYNDDEYLYNMIALGNCIATLTVVIRRCIYDNSPKYYIGKKWAMEDKPTWLEIAAVSKIGYLDSVTSSYRVVSGSASHGKKIENVLHFASSGFELDNFYDKIYNVGVNRPKSGFYLYCMKEALRFDDKITASDILKKARKDRCLNSKIILLYLGTKLSLSRVLHQIGIFKR